MLHFLNYRIIQSKYGTKIDQFTHIQKSILQEFFDKGTTIPFQLSPLMLTQSIEMEIFKDGSLLDKECTTLYYRYNGTYSHWTGALLHIAEKSRRDLQYLGMRLAGYNNCPSATCYQILYLGMCYLQHHSHVPIMFLSKLINEKVPMKSNFCKGRSKNNNKRLCPIHGITSMARCWIRTRYSSCPQISIKLSAYMERSHIRISMCQTT